MLKIEDRHQMLTYRIINIINESIINSEELYKTLHNMYSDVKVSDEVKELIQTEPMERESE